MKSNASIVILIVALLISVVILFRKSHVNKLRAQSIETAKRNFPIKDYDSLYAKNDTVRFYKNDSFIGMTVTIIK